MNSAKKEENNIIRKTRDLFKKIAILREHFMENISSVGVRKPCRLG